MRRASDCFDSTLLRTGSSSPLPPLPLSPLDRQTPMDGLSLYVLRHTAMQLLCCLGVYAKGCAVLGGRACESS